MRRSFGLLFLILCVLWQTAVMAGGRWAPTEMADVGHAALHWGGAAHHHHDDGSWHADDSGESLAHVQLDGAPQLAALLPAGAAAPAPVAGLAPDSRCRIVLPAPPPDGLRRPPRTAT